MLRILPGINVIPVTNNDTKTFEQKFCWVLGGTGTYIHTYLTFDHFGALPHYLGQQNVHQKVR